MGPVVSCLRETIGLVKTAGCKARNDSARLQAISSRLYLRKQKKSLSEITHFRQTMVGMEGLEPPTSSM